MRGKSLCSSHTTVSKAWGCNRMHVGVGIEEEIIMYEVDGEGIEVLIKL